MVSCRVEFSNRDFVNSLGFFSFLFFKVYFMDYAITVVPIFSSPFSPSSLNCSPTSKVPPLFMSMVCTYKFFVFSISHTILNLPLYILYLPIMLLAPCTFPPFYLLPLPTDNPPCDLHFCESVPILVVCLLCFSLCFFKFGC